MIPERLVFVDLETAGLEPWRPVMQIAAVAVNRDLKEVEYFEAKVRFSHLKADPVSLRKVKYDPAQWAREGRTARQAAEEFAAFLKRHATVSMANPSGGRYHVAQLVAHNASFDFAFLRYWFDKLGLFLPGHYRMLCTLQRAIWLFQEEPTRRPPADFKLGTLCRYFGVRLTVAEAHDALNDVRATVKLYRAMTQPGRFRRKFLERPRAATKKPSLLQIAKPSRRSYSRCQRTKSFKGRSKPYRGA